MRPSATAIAVTFAASLAGAAAASAQDISSPFRFVDERHTARLYYGYAWADRGTAGMASEAGGLYGGRYAFRVGGPLSLVAEAAYFASTRSVITLTEDDEPVRVEVGEGDFNLLLANVGLRFDFAGPRSYHGLMPYLLVLGGGALELSDEPAAEADIPSEHRLDFGTSLGGAFALGADLTIGTRVSIGVEARQALWKIETPEPFIMADPDLPQEEWLGNPIVQFGASLRF